MPWIVSELPVGGVAEGWSKVLERVAMFDALVRDRLELELNTLGPPADVVTVIVAGVALSDRVITTIVHSSITGHLPCCFRFVVAGFICCERASHATSNGTSNY